MEPVKSAPTLQRQQQFYDEFWQAYSPALGGWEIRRLAAILEALSELVGELRTQRDPPRICDFGCGRGWLSGELSKLGPVTGVDLSPQGVALAQKAWPMVNFVAADILAWRPDQQFDLVVSSEVIEHIEDKGRFIDTVHTILRPGGYCVLTTPNKLVKKHYDRSHPSGQLVEAWCTPRELKSLFAGRFALMRHDTFVLDFAYSGMFRIIGAPRLLRALDRSGLRDLYNGIRQCLKLGLYQRLVVRRV